MKDDEALRAELRALYERFGYRIFRMSKFEKYELYSGNKDFLVSDRVITFTDTNGDLMALKPDVTLSIVRSSAYRPGRKQRLYYQENVYRPTGSSRRFREMLQCGLECIGDLDSYDVWEVLRLAHESLCLISEENLLCFSHLGILQSLLSRLDAEESDRAEIRRLTAARSVHGLVELFTEHGWDREVLDALCRLLALSCGPKELPDRIRGLCPDSAVMRELEELARLSEGVPDVHFDFSVLNDTNYYNGIVFQGFIPELSEKILSGGRYDSLMARMDRHGSAIGFAVYFGLLEQLRTPAEDGPDLTLLYDEATPLTEIRDTARRMRAEGRRVSVQRRAEPGDGEILDIRRERHA